MAGRRHTAAWAVAILQALVPRVGSVVLSQDPLPGPEGVDWDVESAAEDGVVRKLESTGEAATMPLPGVIGQAAPAMPEDVAAQVFVEGGVRGTPCSAAEKRVIVPVTLVTRRIHGLASVGKTIPPEKLPPACIAAVGEEWLTACYQSWGFAREVAKCYAKEKHDETTACTEDCTKNLMPKWGSLPCMQCQATLRQERRACSWFAMAVKPQCQKCQLNAYAAWDRKCAVECRNAFQDGFNVATPECRKCNEKLENALVACGAQ